MTLEHVVELLVWKLSKLDWPWLRLILPTAIQEIKARSLSPSGTKSEKYGTWPPVCVCYVHESLLPPPHINRIWLPVLSSRIVCFVSELKPSALVPLCRSCQMFGVPTTVAYFVAEVSVRAQGPRRDYDSWGRPLMGLLIRHQSLLSCFQYNFKSNTFPHATPLPYCAKCFRLGKGSESEP